MARRRLILLTGMAGSGKTTLSTLIRESGLRVITMGDVIRELAKSKGLEPTRENIGQLAEEIRKEGPDAVARRCVEILKKGPEGLIVVDGIRSIAEVDAFMAEFDVVLIALWASPLSRYKRLTRRGRSDDPKTWEEFKERERRELGFGIGDAIASSDYMIKNDDGIGSLKPAFDEIMVTIRNG
jgi:dephospho-CoA kinase